MVWQNWTEFKVKLVSHYIFWNGFMTNNNEKWSGLTKHDGNLIGFIDMHYFVFIAHFWDLHFWRRIKIFEQVSSPFRERERGSELEFNRLSSVVNGVCHFLCHSTARHQFWAFEFRISGRIRFPEERQQKIAIPNLSPWCHCYWKHQRSLTSQIKIEKVIHLVRYS